MTDAQLYAPYAHVAALKSKNLRDVLVDALNVLLCAPPTHVAAVKAVVTKLHNASLLLDDIEDSAPRRRGVPTAHTIFGVPLTMNTANLVIFDALGDCVPLHPDAAAIFQEELVLLHRGQGQDIFWRDANHCPTLAEYKVMVQNKTGGLFRLALRLLALRAEPREGLGLLKERLQQLCDDISYFFQVLDDLLNLCSSDYQELKCFCEDLTEGKFSFLTVHSVLSARLRDDERLLSVLRSRPQSVDVKLFCLQLLRETGSFVYTRCHLEEVHAQLLSGLQRLEREAHGDVAPLEAFVGRLRAMVPTEMPASPKTVVGAPSFDPR